MASPLTRRWIEMYDYIYDQRDKLGFMEYDQTDTEIKLKIEAVTVTSLMGQKKSYSS